MANCRFCNSKLEFEFINLGMQPIANSIIPKEEIIAEEVYYPLQVFVCSKCFLVQSSYDIPPDHIYEEYPYFSSYSESWLQHAKTYSQMIREKLNLSKNSFVIEIASNDGYLLKNFKDFQIPYIGIEPSKNIANYASANGINTLCDFFTYDLSKEISRKYGKADLIIGNNVFAHVPNVKDFVSGIKNLLAPTGVLTLEFPYLKNLIEQNQFDTIYHEHFFYYSLLSASNILESQGLKIFDIEELITHGGSLRLYVSHIENDGCKISEKLKKIFQNELKLKYNNVEFYLNFKKKVYKTKFKILNLLIDIKSQNKSIVAYGAPAKGNTLLNFCGISVDFIDFTVDKNPQKQNTLLPGSHIPVLNPEAIYQRKPDYILILPWNIKNEIMGQLSEIRSWNGKFIIPIPEIEIL